MIISKEKKSSVIGMWRMGNPSYKIALYNNLTEVQVEQIIIEYQDKLKKNELINAYPIKQ